MSNDWLPPEGITFKDYSLNRDFYWYFEVKVKGMEKLSEGMEFEYFDLGKAWAEERLKHIQDLKLGRFKVKIERDNLKKEVSNQLLKLNGKYESWLLKELRAMGYKFVHKEELEDKMDKIERIRRLLNEEDEEDEYFDNYSE